MKNDSLITRYKILKGERDESIFTIIIALVVKLGLVAWHSICCLVPRLIGQAGKPMPPC